MARNQANAVDEVMDVDARPSDAINLAVRFGAPMFVNKRVAEAAAHHAGQAQATHAHTSETHADIVKSIRLTLSSYEDPTIMMQLQKELAIKEDRCNTTSLTHKCTYSRVATVHGYVPTEPCPIPAP